MSIKDHTTVHGSRSVEEDAVYDTPFCSDEDDDIDPNWPIPAGPVAAYANIKVTQDDHLVVTKGSKRRRLYVIGLVAATSIIIILALTIGLVLGLRHSTSSASSVEAPSSDSPDGGHGGGSQSNSTSQPTSSSGSSDGSGVTCSSAFGDSFSTTSAWTGINIGNWLILEQWMNPSYWSPSVVGSATDEWSFCKALGNVCGSTLEQHWNDWLVETEVKMLVDNGFNLFRVPIGFWAFIQPYSWEPYYTGNQTLQLTRLLSYAQKYNFSIIIDLHGLPGSQNGEQHSGHIGSINWFNSTNQLRSGLMLDAALSYIANSPFQSKIAALEVANEPNIYQNSDLKVYKKYLTTAFQKIKAYNTKLIKPLTLMFQDGFIGSTKYQDTFDNCDQVVVDLHQYYFESANSQSSVDSEICSFSVPTESYLRQFYGEWSLSSGYTGGNQSWQLAAFNKQTQNYAKSLGSAFWSFKTYNINGASQNDAWSLLGLIQSVTSMNATWPVTSSIC